MNAKLIVLNDKMEIKLSNGVSFLSLQDEDLNDFVNRVEAVVERDYLEDLSVTMVEAKNFAKTTVAQLQKNYANATGLEAELIASVIESKGGELVVAPKAAKPTAEPKAPTEPKEPKAPIARATYEEAVALCEASKANIGSICTFNQFRTALTVTGEVKQVIIDKRVNMVLYRIIGTDGLLYHITPLNPSFKIDAKATKELQATRAAEAKAKADQIAEAAKARQAAKEAATAARTNAMAERKAEIENAKAAKIAAAQEAKAAKEAEAAANKLAKETAAKEAQAAKEAKAQEVQAAKEAKAKEAQAAKEIKAQELAAKKAELAEIAAKKLAELKAAKEAKK